MRGIVKGGEIIPLDVSVADGRQQGLWFAPPRGCRPRKVPVDFIVWHHTGGERGHEGIYETLESQGYSVHFTIAFGSVVQMADMETVCYHAGRRGSGRSIGVETRNRGLHPNLWGHHRRGYDDVVHGKERRFLRFHDEDIAAAIALYDALTVLHALPQTFPLRSDGEVRTTKLDGPELDAFRGHLGHLHLTTRRVGPSPHLMRELQARASLP